MELNQERTVQSFVDRIGEGVEGELEVSWGGAESFCKDEDEVGEDEEGVSNVNW